METTDHQQKHFRISDNLFYRNDLLSHTGDNYADYGIPVQLSQYNTLQLRCIKEAHQHKFVVIET